VSSMSSVSPVGGTSRTRARTRNKRFLSLVILGLVAALVAAAPAKAAVPVGGPVFSLVNDLGHRCLDADLNTIGHNGTVVQLWDCNFQNQQRWTATRAADSVGIIIVSIKAYRCLDADAPNAFKNGARVQLWTCNNTPQQEWFEYQYSRSPGLKAYVNRLSGKCLDADTNTIGRNGTRMQLWQCNGQRQQQFGSFIN
jgi:Ricin-type beta-trefoil lectin domain